MKRFEAVFLGKKDGKITFFKMCDTEYKEHEAPVGLKWMEHFESLNHGEQFMANTNDGGFVDNVHTFKKVVKRPRKSAPVRSDLFEKKAA